MKNKTIVVGDFIDPETGLRFIEDDRGVYHLIKPGEDSSANTRSLEREVQRLNRVMEKLRVENNWLWGVLEIAKQDSRKKSPGYAMTQLEKKIKERSRI